MELDFFDMIESFFDINYVTILSQLKYTQGLLVLVDMPR